jgi:succinyl-CoA synthetase beta subunit
MDIEAVAEETPEKIITVAIDPEAGVTAADRCQAQRRAGTLRRCRKGRQVAVPDPLQGVHRKGHERCSKINPLIVMKNGRLRVLDAKVSFDGNALFRHDDIVELRDLTEEDDKEIEASKYDLAYVALDGNIGCMVNGAGLAMATMDIIKLYGAGAGELPRRRRRRQQGKGHGGVQDHHRRPGRERHSGQHLRRHHACDVIAEGVVAAVKEVGLKVPLVVRLEGTNVALGKKIINESGLNVIAADDLDDAAQKIVNAVKGS